MKVKILIFLLLGVFFETNAQNDDYYEDEYEEVYLEPINDKSDEGQKIFVEELLDLAGYIIDEIEIYQRLPNHAKVFRVKYDEKSKGGFIFIRWDKENKENYVANKMIDPGLYYNLKAAKEIMRKQTDKDFFGVEDGALQAPDQEKISTEDLKGLRGLYEEKQEERKLKKQEQENKEKKKIDRKKKKEKNKSF
tara:strand:+ start:515 stop:1093 length:579 start_codon:yes stop_codon:yes gene_type:complete